MVMVAHPRWSRPLGHRGDGGETGTGSLGKSSGRILPKTALDNFTTSPKLRAARRFGERANGSGCTPPQALTNRTGAGEMAKRNRTTTRRVENHTRLPRYDPERDRALEFAGKALYDATWVGEPSSPDRKLLADNPSDSLPADLNKARAVVMARLHRDVRELQMREVIHWLQSTHGLGMVPRNAPQSKLPDHYFFNPAQFKAFAKTIPTGDTQRRQAAVRKLLRVGKVPGRGGIAWELFRRLVKEEGGGTFDLKTIKRDVAAAQALKRVK